MFSCSSSQKQGLTLILTVTLPAFFILLMQNSQQSLRLCLVLKNLQMSHFYQHSETNISCDEFIFTTFECVLQVVCTVRIVSATFSRVFIPNIFRAQTIYYRMHCTHTQKHTVIITKQTCKQSRNKSYSFKHKIKQQISTCIELQLAPLRVS